MKAKNLSQLIKVFNPNLHLDETQHQFYVNIFGKELDTLVTEIVHAPNNQIFLITGQSGNGKTSMLRNLQKEYPNELKEFHFLYFEKALKHLEEYDKSIKTTMIKVNELKFIATVYLDGERASQCKIWMGGVFGSTSISYAIGDSYMDINNDNTCNDWLSLEEDEEGLYMKSSGMMYLLHNHDKKIRNPKEAGEYFWKPFIELLER